MSEFKIGDYVKIHPDYCTRRDNPDDVYEVIKVPTRANEKNLQSIHLKTGSHFRMDPALLVPATKAEGNAQRPKEELPTVGSVVRVDASPALRGKNFVVHTIHPTRGAVIYLLGGGESYRNVHVSLMKVVPMDKVTINI